MDAWVALMIPFMKGELGQGLERVWGGVVAKGYMFICGHAEFVVSACMRMAIEYSGLERTGLEMCNKVASDLGGLPIIPHM